MMKRSEVIVVGAGPAGIVAAIAAQKRGLQTIVLDARIPPIDKSCGEGILPQGVAALRALGISLPAESTLALRGSSLWMVKSPCARILRANRVSPCAA